MQRNEVRNLKSWFATSSPAFEPITMTTANHFRFLAALEMTDIPNGSQESSLVGLTEDIAGDNIAALLYHRGARKLTSRG